MLLGQCSQRTLPVLSLGVLMGIVVFGQSIINIRLYSANRFFQTARFNIFTLHFQWRHVSARILLCITVRCFNNNAFYCNWICPSWVYWSHDSAHKTLSAICGYNSFQYFAWEMLFCIAVHLRTTQTDSLYFLWAIQTGSLELSKWFNSTEDSFMDQGSLLSADYGRA